MAASSPNLHLIVYADHVHATNRKRVAASARKYGFSQVHEFGRRDLKADGFAEKNRHILKFARGGGYCLWKPYVISRVMAAAEEGDLLLYCDAGVDLVSDPRSFVEEVCRTQDIVLFDNQGRKNAIWTRRDAFVLMNADEPKYWEGEQANAAISIYRNTAAARAFVAEWLAACEDSRIITDAPNVCGRPNLPGFIDHRYDQSVLSILARKHELMLHRAPLHEGSTLPPQTPPGQVVFLHHRSEGFALLLVRKYANLRIKLARLAGR
jgi:hypothetical protein